MHGGLRAGVLPTQASKGVEGGR